MKKTLLLQTALVAAAGLFVADIANAQTKATPIGVTVGGYMVRNLAVDDTDAAAANTTAVTRPGTFMSTPDAEVWFNIRGVLDNGTVVGGRIELEGYTATDTIDESYMFLERADVGRIELGSTDRVSNKMLYGAPTAIPGHSTTQVSENSSIANSYSLWLQNTDNDSEGINIYTASNRYFGSKAGKGLQLGLSWVPNDSEDTVVLNDRTNRQDTLVLAANYLESFGPVDAAVFVGWARAESLTNSDPSGEEVGGWQAGTTLVYNVGGGSAVQFGGLYTREDTDINSKRRGYSLGIRYLTNGAAPGSVGIGLEGSRGKIDNVTTTTEDQDVETLMLGVTYQLATGVLGFAGAGMNELDSTTNANDVDQTFGVVGLRLDF